MCSMLHMHSMENTKSVSGSMQQVLRLAPSMDTTEESEARMPEWQLWLQQITWLHGITSSMSMSAIEPSFEIS
jgi:hypothetical protein